MWRRLGPLGADAPHLSVSAPFVTDVTCLRLQWDDDDDDNENMAYE